MSGSGRAVSVRRLVLLGLAGAIAVGLTSVGRQIATSGPAPAGAGVHRRATIAVSHNGLADLMPGAPSVPRGTRGATGDPGLLRGAAEVRRIVARRYGTARGRKLTVEDVSSTGVVTSLTLLDDVLREVPAANGVYFNLCAPAAFCPFPPARSAWDVRELRPRRAAFELAVRMFSATDADLVVVSLPTPTPVLVVLRRGEIRGSLKRAFTVAVSGDPAVASTDVRCVVDENTLPHLYVPLGTEAVSEREDTLVAAPLHVSPLPARPACESAKAAH